MFKPINYGVSAMTMLQITEKTRQKYWLWPHTLSFWTSFIVLIGVNAGTVFAKHDDTINDSEFFLHHWKIWSIISDVDKYSDSWPVSDI
jgi:hypothetical protein